MCLLQLCLYRDDMMHDRLIMFEWECGAENVRKLISQKHIIACLRNWRNNRCLVCLYGHKFVIKQKDVWKEDCKGLNVKIILTTVMSWFLFT